MLEDDTEDEEVSSEGEQPVRGTRQNKQKRCASKPASGARPQKKAAVAKGKKKAGGRPRRRLEDEVEVV